MWAIVTTVLTAAAVAALIFWRGGSGDEGRSAGAVSRAGVTLSIRGFGGGDVADHELTRIGFDAKLPAPRAPGRSATIEALGSRLSHDRGASKFTLRRLWKMS
jgi:hypothetical protein